MIEKTASHMPWIKLYVDGFTEGSISEWPIGERGVWAVLLAQAGKCKFRDGRLLHGEGEPMTIAWIARHNNIEEQLLQVVIDKCMQDRNSNDDLHRIERLDDGTYKITNFSVYQEKRTKEKKERTEPSDAAKQAMVTKWGIANPEKFKAIAGNLEEGDK